MNSYINNTRSDSILTINVVSAEDRFHELKQVFGDQVALVFAAVIIHDDNNFAALKRTADGTVLTPEGWRPGHRLLAQPTVPALLRMRHQSACTAPSN